MHWLLYVSYCHIGRVNVGPQRFGFMPEKVSLLFHKQFITLEPILAAYWLRQGTPLDELPANSRALCEHFDVRYLAQGYLGQ